MLTEMASQVVATELGMNREKCQEKCNNVCLTRVCHSGTLGWRLGCLGGCSELQPQEYDGNGNDCTVAVCTPCCHQGAAERRGHPCTVDWLSRSKSLLPEPVLFIWQVSWCVARESQHRWLVSCIASAILASFTMSRAPLWRTSREVIHPHNGTARTAPMQASVGVPAPTRNSATAQPHVLG
jgi:hypothetical protein